ncbi:hypothetical protein H6501_04465 [Candidatus Woesearchaeota archaeon]|nr:hypothetical protein [Candidatus Woesearchaeota archaeon]USN43925.1 MAG: hypothetical protein H6500_06065 [Candidatus Woesearchaeota archaeon]
MDFGIILVLVLVLLGIFIVVKFIKKLVAIVFSIFLILLLGVAAVFGLVYLDARHLTTTSDFDVYVLYKDDSSQVSFGVLVPVRSKEIDFSLMRNLDGEELSLSDETLDNENDFKLIVPDSVFSEMIEGESYNISSSLEKIGVDVDAILSSEDLHTLMDGNGDVDAFVDLILEKNGIRGTVAEAARPVLISEISEGLSGGVSLQGFLFLSSFYESLQDEQGLIVFLDAYKKGDVEIYPDRLSLKLLRALPVETVKEKLFSSKAVVGEP